MAKFISILLILCLFTSYSLSFKTCINSTYCQVINNPYKYIQSEQLNSIPASTQALITKVKNHYCQASVMDSECRMTPSDCSGLNKECKTYIGTPTWKKMPPAGLQLLKGLFKHCDSKLMDCPI
ncbi:hypothetical protein DICPUDRAFT_81111 [Dictyostelium purpureum]|uniref:FZ domain-containing protein n=1 Tax=Dictyostelium purpureum TaxID=5786 RepID=F0ZSI4_DICPU|nr:uncharacterized protein DICPUDRAFT_81111 [Dictyostelium purpureum]EGC33096.1 hypothetical protein DICPUDRAFT_81111 [Dictyostelium purpureum]|eukprot:XP_003290373.1 hypothetical protein DICPUDRAFT_81111 [Dictyostelium purpureum]